MTEVIETETLVSRPSDDGSIRDALDLIDRGLGDICERTIIPSSEMADLLLDVRSVLAKLDAQVSTN